MKGKDRMNYTFNVLRYIWSEGHNDKLLTLLGIKRFFGGPAAWPRHFPSLPDTEFCHRKYFMTWRAFRARRQDWTAHAILQKYALGAKDQTSSLSVGVWNSKLSVQNRQRYFFLTAFFLFVPHCKQNASLRCLCIHVYQGHNLLSNQLTSSNSHADQIPRLSSDVKGNGTTEYLHNLSDCN